MASPKLALFLALLPIHFASAQAPPPPPPPPVQAQPQAPLDVSAGETKLGFHTSIAPYRDDVDLRGIWHKPAPPTMPRHMGSGFMLRYESYNANQELVIIPIAAHGQSMVMARHQATKNLYYLKRYMELGRPVGTEFSWENTPMRLLVDSPNEVFFDYRDEAIGWFNVQRSRYNVQVPNPRGTSPVIATGRWSFGDGKPNWTISGLNGIDDGDSISQPGGGIATIRSNGSLMTLEFPEEVRPGVRLLNMFHPIKHQSNLYYAATQLEVSESRTNMFDSGFHKDKPNFLWFDSPNGGYFQPHKGDPIPLKRLSYWTIDPQGEWVSKVGTSSNAFTFQFAEGEEDVVAPNLTMKYPDKSIVITFKANRSRPNVYHRPMGRKSNGPLSASQIEYQEVEIKKSQGNVVAYLKRRDNQVVELERKVTDDMIASKQEGIEDPAWEKWIRTQQQTDWLSRLPTRDVTAEEGFIGEFQKNFDAVCYGYNVLAMDPFDLRGIYRGFEDSSGRGYEAKRPRGFGVTKNSFDYKFLGKIVITRPIFLGHQLDSQNWYFDANRTGLRLPQSFRAYKPTSAGGKTNKVTIFNENSLKETKSINVGLQAGSEKMSGGGSFGYSTELEKLNSENKVMIFETGGSANVWLCLSKRFARLHQNFISDVNKLPLQTGQVQVAQNTQAFSQGSLVLCGSKVLKKTGPSEWSEVTLDGTTAFRFRETRKTSTAIEITRPAVTLTIDLQTKEVKYKGRRLWNITRTYTPPMNQDDLFRAHIEFFESYGTHYPIQTLLGARATYTEFQDASTVAETLSKSFKANGSAPIPKVPATVNVAYEEGTVESNKSSTNVVNGSWKLVGTDGATVAVNEKTLDLRDGDAPVKVSLAPIYELLLPRLFLADDQKARQDLFIRRELMEHFYNRYLRLARNARTNREPIRLNVEVGYLGLDEGQRSMSGLYTSKPIRLNVFQQNRQARSLDAILGLELLNIPENKSINDITSERGLSIAKSTVSIYVPKKLVGNTFVPDFSAFTLVVSGSFSEWKGILPNKGPTEWNDASVNVLTDDMLKGAYVHGNRQMRSFEVKTKDRDDIGRFRLYYNLWPSDGELPSPGLHDPFPNAMRYHEIADDYVPSDY